MNLLHFITNFTNPKLFSQVTLHSSLAMFSPNGSGTFGLLWGPPKVWPDHWRHAHGCTSVQIWASAHWKWIQKLVLQGWKPTLASKCRAILCQVVQQKVPEKVPNLFASLTKKHLYDPNSKVGLISSFCKSDTEVQ